MIINTLGLNGIEWLRPLMTLVTLAISITANCLFFIWILWILPRHHPQKNLY